MDMGQPEHPESSDWQGFLHHNANAETLDEGLRERKKRLTRKKISDTATTMFIARGFDDVKITEIAAACDVSEKTIYNYFPTKESLVLDIEDEMTHSIDHALGPNGASGSPVEATMSLIAVQVQELVAHLQNNNELDTSPIRAFMDMIDTTPSLRAAQFDMTERLAQVAARAMARRAGINPEDPEPQIAADTLMGLWRLYFRATDKYARVPLSPATFAQLVLEDVERAGRLIDTGLWSFAMTVQGTDSRDQLRVAAEASNEARKQVIRALREAKAAWMNATTEIALESRRARGHENARARTNARSSAQEIRDQARQLKRDVNKLKQEFRSDVREKSRTAKRSARSK